MPAKNSIKVYEENSYYHIYNRGVEKRDIFLDQQDFGTFLSYLKSYLSFKDTKALSLIIGSGESTRDQKQRAINELHLNNFFGNIELLAYTLMPNHFHLLIRQETATTMDAFINSLGTRYTMFFNQKHERVGPLYQGVYKAVKINTDEQLLHVSRYIHLNPFKLLGVSLSDWQKIKLPSSLPDYLGAKHTSWLKTDTILDYFSKDNPNNTYSNFMGEPSGGALIVPLALDYEDVAVPNNL